MFKDITGSFVRHVLTSFLGGLAAWLIENGASPADAEVIVTGLAAAFVFCWSFLQKARKNKEVKKALYTPVPELKHNTKDYNP
jgi:hypothetical protein